MGSNPTEGIMKKKVTENDKLYYTIEILRKCLDAVVKERDEARKEICNGSAHPELEAEERGWDCFNEDSK